ncbi:MAG: hypothetical protein OXK16_07690 [bacterium]|nr:hypothetical protein [bacterium]
MNPEHPDHNDRYRRVRQAWDTYQAVEQARADASAELNAELATARNEGVTMYRMAKWLGITERAIKVRLQTHDRTSNPSPPTD